MLLWMSLAYADPPAGPDRPAPIVNGVVEQGYDATVGLAFGPWVLCTGSLVTPRVVLTAAHCLVDIPPDVFVDSGVILTGTRSVTPEGRFAIQKVKAHPGYVPLEGGVFGQTLPENDLGVVILRDPVPDEVHPVWIRTERLTREDAIDQIVTSVGYGLDEVGASGTKRSAPLVVSDLDDEFVLSLNADNENDANICSGDSGGPQYHLEADGTLVQWAVHSWGDQSCAFESGSTRVDRESDWILKQIESTHGTTDRCEILGLYGDGVCDASCDQLDDDCWLSWADIVDMGRPDAGACSTGPRGAWWMVAFLAPLFRRRRWS
ncbi:MAG: trypsin-like serine protease [Alphaproteobacteria bacterium]|nr:trypsin-like serine protease [Alphaproteobacteria bacterium]MCB9696885.1 trypsin-like serine protease [Alphaproteobacteria bacterium]